MNIVAENPIYDKTYRSIAVTNVRLGQGDTVATLDLKVGGVFIRRVHLRRGRGGSVYLNFPSFKNEHGRWLSFVEITSQPLADAINHAVMAAVAEVER